MTYLRHVLTQFDDTPDLDAFGRLRTGTPMGLWTAKLLYNQNTDRWLSKTSGGGASKALSGGFLRHKGPCQEYEMRFARHILEVFIALHDSVGTRCGSYA